MTKKIFTFGLLLSLLAFCNLSIAQEQEEYPRYGFWSNWSIGASVDFVKQMNGNHWDFKEGTSAGFSIMIEKELNYVWDLRFDFAIPGLFSNDQKPQFDRYGFAGVGMKFSITDAIMGYNPARRSSIYLVGMTGLTYVRDEDITSNLRGNLGNTHFLLAAAGGLGYSYQICKHGTFFIEGLGDVNAAIPNWFGFGKDNNSNRRLTDFYVNLGFMYNFGPTKADQELIAQRNFCSVANCNALNEQVNDLQSKLDAKDQQIKKLENRIAELENELANVPQGNTAAADSLQRQIDQLKADQMVFYALPFSILYDVDQYTVSESEMQKLEAIARVMKDNPNTKYNVYGFCDNTGSQAYNQKLSEKRVNEVKRLLVKKYGIAEDRLNTEGKGQTMCFGDLKYSVNRRVSFYRVMD